MYEIFEHTADLGIRAEADSFPALLVEAANALTSVLVVNPQAVHPTSKVDLVIEGTEPGDLLVDWLSELLYRFSAQHMLYCKFEIVSHGSHIAARAWGENVDPQRHQIDSEIKAITYHNLKVEQDANQWRAEVIVDL